VGGKPRQQKMISKGRGRGGWAQLWVAGKKKKSKEVEIWEGVEIGIWGERCPTKGRRRRKTKREAGTK